ncbi:MAG: amidohydrolase family protein [Candidatus Latescibacterota bacterium]
MRIVDTHAHIYHADEQLYPMKPDPYRPPAGMGTVEHLRRDMAANGVERVVLVQTGSAYRWDNRLLADTADACRDWAVGVCTLDPAAEGSVTVLERLVREKNVKGVRMETATGGVYHHAGSERLWQAAGRLGAVVCAHLSGDLLGELDVLLQRFPEVPVVLDHCAYPDPARGVDDPIVQRLCRLAARPQLYPKLSFGVTNSRQQYPFADSLPLLQRIIATYGPDRCLWGSGFPCEHWLRKATYGQHLDLFRIELGLSPAEQEGILARTPLRVWFAP